MERCTSHFAQIAMLTLAIAAVYALPLLVDTFSLVQFTLFAALSVLALSLGFVWGYGGIMCFGQTAFFGLGGYAYAVAAINFGDSTPAIAVAILIPSLFALVLGYFIFYGGVSDVYLSVITLTVTLILFNAVNSTAGEEYRIGNAPLGGFNGLPSIPTFNLPLNQDTVLDPISNWYVTGASLVLAYLLLRLVLASRFGRVVVAVRENEIRASLLGYDPRKIKLGVFIIGGAIAGYSGALYVNWGAFVSPTIFGLSLSAEIIIWVTIGGLGTLIGPIISCFIVQYLNSKIGSQQVVNSNFVLGALLIAFVLLLPKGMVPTFQMLTRKAMLGCRAAAPLRDATSGIVVKSMGAE